MITVMFSVFNEEKNIAKAVENAIDAAKRAGNIPLDIIVVDDASTDKTPEIIKKLEKKYPFVRSIHHLKNQGIGVGLREVIKIAKYPKFMLAPGDNDASPKLLEHIFRNSTKAEMVLSYYLNKELRKRTRNFLSTIYGLIYMLTFDVYIQYFNGVGVYPTEKIRNLDLKSSRFSITAELNTKLLCSGCTLYELPGYMQTGIEGSKSIKLINFIEVIVTYFRLVYEIKLTKRDFFAHKPRRIEV